MTDQWHSEHLAAAAQHLATAAHLSGAGSLQAIPNGGVRGESPWPASGSPATARLVTAEEIRRADLGTRITAANRDTPRTGTGQRRRDMTWGQVEDLMEGKTTPDECAFGRGRPCSYDMPCLHCRENMITRVRQARATTGQVTVVPADPPPEPCLARRAADAAAYAAGIAVALATFAVLALSWRLAIAAVVIPVAFQAIAMQLAVAANRRNR